MAGQVVVEVTYESVEGDQIGYTAVREVSDDLPAWYAAGEAADVARTQVVESARKSGWIR